MRFLYHTIYCILPFSLFGQELDTCLITYDIGHTTLTQQHIELIDSFFLQYQQIDSLEMTITGSADYLGNESLNQKISDKRVAGVADYLMQTRDGLSVTRESKGEVNSHLENELGREGMTTDRSVQIIVRPIYPEPMEVVVDFKEGGQIKTGESLILKDLNFHPGRHQLLPPSIPYLKELLEILLVHPDINFEIQGHICCLADTPTERDGRDVDTGENKLSYNRAKNIYEYLVKNGVDSTKLTYRGYGFSQPLNFPETDQQSRMENRRVVIKVLGRGKN